jgi:hypothetical protein
MKIRSIALLLFVQALATGCNSLTPEVSTTANTENEERSAAKVPIPDQPIQTFSLSVPFENVTLVQGGQAAVKIGINRGENFGEEVAVKVTGLPAGVTLEKEGQVITKGNIDTTLNLKAASDASIGDFTVKVIGHTSSSSADFSEEIKITVTQRE